MAETERVIQKRYLLQRVVAQGQVCTIYQGFDQVLQRAIALKIVPAVHIPACRAAIRMTASFSHPNIIGTYDLIQEQDVLYIVQEYVDGDTFPTLLQAQLNPHAVADFGLQVCQALLYAGSSTRKVCHGDLTPAAVVRDHRGLVRVGGFALPSDVPYFTAWSAVGGEGNAVSDRELPWGKVSDGRRADDTRAVGILLYQLLAGRALEASIVEPPTDGRLRFMRNVPVELCEIIARTLIRQHPQHINNVETLYEVLKEQADTLEPSIEMVPTGSSRTEEGIKANRLLPSSNPSRDRLVTALPTREAGQAVSGLPSFHQEPNAQSPQMAAMAQQPVSAPPAVAQKVADASFNPPMAQSSVYPQTETQSRRLSLPVLLFLGLLIFAAFFVVGYFVARAVFP